ncbi:hypothetical protein CC1G_09581 [Coprinopsis cinerea okayama7|uniref:Hypervirulence associated protein TUDOR domain-containing protein n=1 Tax=Coprinopsis cinerea (strain Okayama-7 / 130 / ATCC MYA-4618 / FGSC 9003) TaxID=240176 RepID=A8P992_COPC7|nr:hypothetical protein CC1G_09581 [Coprinopsis cinerea okayama7\|eukprot:XP_001839726.1 hypothetical protein CC1G_09581 [Coprinopsis cinerea okayama7\
MSPSNQVVDKEGMPIHVGDEVSCRARGGKHVGKVEKIVYTKEEAEEEGVKNPPKVIYTDQHGHRVNHNPGTLVHGDPF